MCLVNITGHLERLMILHMMDLLFGKCIPRTKVNSGNVFSKDSTEAVNSCVLPDFDRVIFTQVLCPSSNIDNNNNNNLFLKSASYKKSRCSVHNTVI